MARTQIGGAQIGPLDLTTEITGVLPVANGGTGNATNTLNSLLVGNGTGAVAGLAPSTAGNIPRSSGSAWASGVQWRANDVASSGTPSLDAAVYDQLNLTALAVPVTSFTITNAYSGQPLIVRIKDNGTGRAFAPGSTFRAIGVTIPTITIANKTLYIGGRWNSADSKLDVLAIGQEA